MFQEELTHQHNERARSMRSADPAPKVRRSVSTIVLCAFLGIAAFFLWTEHRAHLLGALPYLLLLACPLLHVFMHRGHGHGNQTHSDPDNGPTRSP